MSYSIPDGHQMIYRGLDVFFNDSVYDGVTTAEKYGKEKQNPTVTRTCSRWLTP